VAEAAAVAVTSVAEAAAVETVGSLTSHKTLKENLMVLFFFALQRMFRSKKY
jgi:hypothetical protein